MFEEMPMRRNVGLPVCNDKHVWERKDFCGDVKFVFRMLVSAYEVQLNAATMICIKCGNEENSRSVVCG